LLTVTTRRLTDFEQVLLGLVRAAPSTGYDLKSQFAATPLRVYQPSSGAIYPALRRLERAGLLRTGPGSQESAVQDGRARRRIFYHITDQGRAMHTAWIRQPVDPATIAADLPLHMMRFVMMEGEVSRKDVLAFLTDLRDALTVQLQGLESYAAAAATAPLYLGRHHPSLAMDHGVSTRAASLAWVKRTINALAGPEPGAVSQINVTAPLQRRLNPGDSMTGL
jgi:DNA-binding PadR family transcriptional regulator